ncbi:MAG: RidA family protein [Bacteroidetes bacterium]|jgi:2-iminobutanoate/2-iminopropanoate deaminase|nr:RidA family protein [Bacteroidota bacterium]
MKKIIKTADAPEALGPYSQAVEINGTLYVSGQIGIDPGTGKIVPGGVEEQTTQVLKNIKAILRAAGFTIEDVVKSTCYLSDMTDFMAMNKIYGRVYEKNPPVRAAVAVKDLPLGALIEIETIAVKQ